MATTVRVSSVQRVARRDGSETVSLCLHAGESGVGAWCELTQLHTLNDQLGGHDGVPGLQLPAEAALLVNPQAREHLAEQLRALWLASEQRPALRELLGATLGLEGSAEPPSDKSPATDDIATAVEALAARARRRALLQVARSALEARKQTKAALAALAALVALTLLSGRPAARAIRLLGLGAAAAAAAAMMRFEKALALALGNPKKTRLLKGAAESSSDQADVRALRKAIETQRVAAQNSDAEEPEAEGGDPVTQLIQAMDALDEKREFEAEFELLQDGWLDAEGRPRELLWRVARAGYFAAEEFRRASDSLTDPQRLEALQAAVDASKEMVERFPDDFEAHKYFAIAVQEFSNHQGTREKITAGYEFLNHTTRAIELNPTDATLQYMMGRFSFEVGKLSWTERKLARAIFGKEPPTTTVDEALAYFLRARELRPTAQLRDLLEIGRCQAQLRRSEEARESLEAMLALPSSEDPDDEVAKNEARTILAGLR